MMRETTTAMKAAKEAGEILRDAHGSALRIDIKKDGSIVTNADYKAESIIMEMLSSSFPDYGILSEEAGMIGSSEDGLWIIDPLDGTYSFSRNLPIFAVSIALVKHGEIKSGVVYVPMLDEMFHAELNNGAFLNGKRIRVSENREVRNVCINMTGPVLMEKLSLIKKIISGKSKIRVFGSAACELAYLACGRFDLNISMNIKPYDIAAAVLMVREAGGMVSDFNGKKAVIDSRNIIASNSFLHEDVLSFLKD